MTSILDDKNFDARMAKLAEQHAKRKAAFETGYWSKEAIAQRNAPTPPQPTNQKPINWKLLKALHLQTDPTLQLYSIALNLTRIQLLAESNTEPQAARHLVRDSQFLIRWTRSSLNPDALGPNNSVATEQITAKLNEVQQQLEQWWLGWTEIWQNEPERIAIANQAQQWSQSLRSGAECHPHSPA